ncbi:DUF2194 domain-containing protein [Mangrovibacillus cuniculi]|uniref:DUF2194 domain-containing protein n=1 Tax=Mangrovibacillus cuniculi TaxID=2593652 RepID=A0A7S8CD23_9BACI|nr:DUF2194 domain-containing protein [Mangrovibacillus cuniculi]QPC47733.1 DUF2194 domain-containing protein [Mangrovibacillus cuniculi]
MWKKTSLNLFTVVFITVICISVIQYVKVKGFHQVIPTTIPPAEEEIYTSIDHPSIESEESILLLGKEGKLENDSAFQQFKESMKLAKKSYQFLDSLEGLKPNSYQVVVLLEKDIAEVERDNIRTYVAKGGNVLVGQRYIDAATQDLYGIESSNGYFEESLNGITFRKDFVPLYEDLLGEDITVPNSSLDVTLKEEAEVYITAEDVPIFWTYKYGEGKIGYWNGTMLHAKESRGLFLQSISLLPDKFVSTQVGASVFFIDDFPSPITTSDYDEIEKEYKESTTSFFRNIWWEEMKGLRSEFGLKYTHAFIGTYQDTHSIDAEELIELNERNFLFFGRDSLALGDELSLHGYNHQSLVTKDEPIDPELGYTPWKSQKAMEAATKDVMDMFDYFFPDYQVITYVPPSNVINDTGIRAIKSAHPPIQIISSLYLGNAELGTYIQEFGQDQVDPSLFHLPRSSSGFDPNETEKRGYIDLLANAGMFSHFIHPDDLLDPNRNKGGIGQTCTKK